MRRKSNNSCVEWRFSEKPPRRMSVSRRYYNFIHQHAEILEALSKKVLPRRCGDIIEMRWLQREREKSKEKIRYIVTGGIVKNSVVDFPRSDCQSDRISVVKFVFGPASRSRRGASLLFFKLINAARWSPSARLGFAPIVLNRARATNWIKKLAAAARQ